MPPKSRKRASGSQAASRKRARGPGSTSVQPVESLTLDQLVSLSPSVLTLHLQAHHLATSGSAHQKAQRLYLSLHPEGGTPTTQTTSDTVDSDINTASQDVIFDKVQEMLDSKMTKMKQRITSLLASKNAGPTTAPPLDNISDASVLGDSPLVDQPAQQSHPVTTPPILGKSLPPVPVKLREKIIRGEYIDFRELLPSNMYSTPPRSNIVTLHLNEESTSQQPITVGAPKPTFKHQVDSFATWMQAWKVFLAIASDHFKNRVFE